MPRGPDVTPTKKRIISLLKDKGLTQQAIADELGIKQSTVSKQLKLLREHPNPYWKGHRTGRKRLLSDYDARFAERRFYGSVCRNAADFRRLYYPEISERTMRRFLKEHDLGGYRVRAKPRLLKIHIRGRRAIARALPLWKGSALIISMFVLTLSFISVHEQNLYWHTSTYFQAYFASEQASTQHADASTHCWGSV